MDRKSCDVEVKPHYYTGDELNQDTYHKSNDVSGAIMRITFVNSFVENDEKQTIDNQWKDNCNGDVEQRGRYELCLVCPQSVHEEAAEHQSEAAEDSLQQQQHGHGSGGRGGVGHHGVHTQPEVGNQS